MNMQANIEEALAFIPSDLPRDEWLKVATAIKSSIGEGGLFLFDSWSKTSEKYNSKAVRAVWKSARVNSRVTAGTIFYFAKQHGYQFKKMSKCYLNEKKFSENLLSVEFTISIIKMVLNKT